MNPTGANLSDLNKWNRWDAPFVCLAKEHEPLASELAASFSLEELAALAAALPFDQKAACTVSRSDHIDRTDFLKRLTTGGKNPRGKVTDAAVYCAAAAQWAASKILEQVLELRKQERAILASLREVLDTSGKRSKLLVDAIQRKE
jgi:hypothetical protein